MSTQDEAANDNIGSANSIEPNDMECRDIDLEPVDEEERRDGCVKDTDVQKRVKEYFNWMISADCGKKHERPVTQHCNT